MQERMWEEDRRLEEGIVNPSLSLWGDTAEKCPPTFLEIFSAFVERAIVRRCIMIGSIFDHNSMLSLSKSVLSDFENDFLKYKNLSKTYNY